MLGIVSVSREPESCPFVMLLIITYRVITIYYVSVTCFVPVNFHKLREFPHLRDEEMKTHKG